MSFDELFRAISDGFRRSPEYVLLYIVLISGFVLFLVFAGIFLARRQDWKNRRAALDRFEGLIRKLDLTINEIDFLNGLAFFLEKPWKKYLLLANENAFLNSLERLDSGSDPLDLAGRISRKCGYTRSEVPSGKSGTRNLVPGMPVKIEFASGALVEGRIAEIGETRFIVEGRGIQPAEGDVVVHIPSRIGILAYKTRAAGSGLPGRLELAHSEEVPAERWGEIGRKGQEYTVWVRRDGSSDPPARTVIYRLQRNGAFLENPSGLLVKGDDVRIFLSLPQQNRKFWINAEITGASLDRTELFARFTHLKR